MMKNKMLSLAVGGLLVVGVTTALADSAYIPVNAEVMPVCHITSSGSLDFGQLSPDNPVDATATTDVVYWCTKGVTADITLSGGQYFNGATKRVISTRNSAEYMSYNVDPVATTGPVMNGPAVPETLTITGHILGVDYANSWYGAYEDTLTIDIMPPS